jgi:putative acetyltransferase
VTDLGIEAADVRGPDAALLLPRLMRELGERYGDDGEGDFRPEDVCAPRAVFLVASLAGRPVGCGALRPMPDGAAEVKRMYVEPDVRGRGVGRRLLAELEGHARRLGYAVVRLETGLLQPEAIRLYEASGYRRIANYGIYVDNPLSVCFEKELGGAPEPKDGTPPLSDRTTR